MLDLPVPGLVEDRNRPTIGDLEQRAAPTAAPTLDGARLRGLIPYGVESRDLGGFREVIEPGALANTSTTDLIATVDHGGVPIGRHPGTLQLEHRDDGMHWSVALPESRSDVREAVERGDLCAGSWRMIVARDHWVGQVRHIDEIRELRDVAVVSNPAYAASTVGHRSTTPPPPAGPTPGPTQRGGRLRVEDRAQTGATVESRIIEAMAGVPRGEARDLTHATASPVEPDDIRNALIDALRANAVVLQAGANLVTTDKKAVTWPILTGDVNVAFYDELEEITVSDVDLATLEIPVKALKAIVRGSSEAFEDSDPDLLQVVADNINLAMALKGDRELAVGNDAKGFKGLLNVTGTQSLAVGGALTWDPIVKAAGLLAEALVPGPYAVLLGPRPATALALTKETTTSNLYAGKPDGVPPVFGTSWFPVTVGVSPTTSAIVFAPKQLTVVLRKAVTVEVDRSQEFSSDAVLVRGRYRLGMDVAHPTAIVKLTGIDAPAIT